MYFNFKLRNIFVNRYLGRQVGRQVFTQVGRQVGKYVGRQGELILFTNIVFTQNVSFATLHAFDLPSSKINQFCVKIIFHFSSERQRHLGTRKKLLLQCHKAGRRHNTKLQLQLFPVSKDGYLNSSGKEHLQLCIYQCDQMVRLFFNILPFATMKISPITSQICRSRLNILPTQKQTVKKLANIC